MVCMIEAFSYLSDPPAVGASWLVIRGLHVSFVLLLYTFTHTHIYIYIYIFLYLRGEYIISYHCRDTAQYAQAAEAVAHSPSQQLLEQAAGSNSPTRAHSVGTPR